MIDLKVTSKMLLLLWMVSNPVVFFLVVAPTQPHLLPWLPGWVIKLHVFLWPLFYRHDLY